MTDVTGFGLVGHLREMLAASKADAHPDLPRIPFTTPRCCLAKSDWLPHCSPKNLTLAATSGVEVDPSTAALLFDPQTSGGLLAAHAEACVAALRRTGTRMPPSEEQLVRSGFAAAASPLR